MSFRVRYLPPPLPQPMDLDGVALHWLYSDAPIAQVGFIWDAPALRSYPAGLRQLLLSLLNEENAKYNAGKLRQRLYQLGWTFRWEADHDALYLTAEGLTENLPQALDLMYDVVAYPLLTESIARPYLERLVEAEKRARATPPHVADARYAHHLWGITYSLISSAPLEQLAQMDITQLRAYHERFLTKGLRAIVLAAPFIPAQIKRWTTWHGQITYELPLVMAIPSICETLPMLAQQVALRIALPWVRPIHPLYAYYRLALVRLGGYFGALLMHSVREEAGLTYGIYARPDTTRAGSYMLISTEVSLDRVSEAVERIHTEIAEWATQPFPDTETLIEVRNYTLLHMMPETVGEWAQRLTRLLGVGLTAEAYIQQAEAINSLENIEAFPELPLPSEPLVQVAVGTEAPIFAAACA